jgi:hypothetical protein
MFFLNSQGWLGNLWFTRVSVAHGRRSAPKSVTTFIVIVLLHVGIIVIALQVKSAKRDDATTPSFKMIYLSPRERPVELELQAPSVKFSPTQIPTTPEIVIEEQSLSTVIFDRASSNAASDSQVFDPKVRQKLSDAQIFNRARVNGQSRDWKESDGRDFVARGDGDCFVSMQKMDSRERAKNWGGTRCGKTDSESMMDRVNADLEARKNPLKTQ